MTNLQQVIVMAFGAFVAVAGFVIWYLRKESGENEIVILGQKAKLSAPALVVILLGCVIFVLPVVLPFIIGSPLETDTTRPDNPTQPSTEVTATDSKERSSSQALIVDGQESEPNSHITQANIIQLGSTTEGKLTNADDRDFYRLRSGPSTERLRIIVRKVRPKAFTVFVYIFDSNECQVTRGEAWGETPLSFAAEVEPNSDYLLRVGCKFTCGKNMRYELVVREER